MVAPEEALVEDDSQELEAIYHRSRLIINEKRRHRVTLFPSAEQHGRTLSHRESELPSLSPLHHQHQISGDFLVRARARHYLRVEANVVHKELNPINSGRRREIRHHGVPKEGAQDRVLRNTALRRRNRGG